MDLDNIQDIELLRKKLKQFYVKMKKDIEYTTYNGRNCTFKKDLYYKLHQDEGGVYLINEDEVEQPWIWMGLDMAEEPPFWCMSL